MGTYAPFAICTHSPSCYGRIAPTDMASHLAWHDSLVTQVNNNTALLRVLIPGLATISI